MFIPVECDKLVKAFVVAHDLIVKKGRPLYPSLGGPSKTHHVCTWPDAERIEVSPGVYE